MTITNTNYVVDIYWTRHLFFSLGIGRSKVLVLRFGLKMNTKVAFNHQHHQGLLILLINSNLTTFILLILFKWINKNSRIHIPDILDPKFGSTLQPNNLAIRMISKSLPTVYYSLFQTKVLSFSYLSIQNYQTITMNLWNIWRPFRTVILQKYANRGCLWKVKQQLFDCLHKLKKN